MDKLQAAVSRGEDRYSVLPARITEIEILTVPDADGQAPGACGCFCGVYILNVGKCLLPKVKGAAGLKVILLVVRSGQVTAFSVCTTCKVDTLVSILWCYVFN